MPNVLATCCVCLKQCLYFQRVMDRDQGDLQYVDKLKIFAPNEVWCEEFNLCNDCVEKLDAAYDFVQTCLKNEEYRKEKLKLKEVKIEESAPFVCDDCGKGFKLKRTLNLHITRIHVKPKRSVKQESSHVNLKEEAELDNGDYKLEIPEKYELQEFENDIAETGSNYSSEEENKDVRKMMLGKKRGLRKNKQPQKCEYCELAFTRTDKYTIHVRSKHTFEKPYKCDLCDAKYFSNHNLAIHKRKHTNEKPYVCSACGKSFISSNDLWQHSKIHEVIRQYKCGECERCFKTHSNLRTHKLQMHLDPALWKFVCTVCGKKFPLNNNLIKHMRRHEGVKPFVCHLCEKRFVEKIDLQMHLLSHSNERLFKCNLCDKDYKKKETLRRHLKLEHDVGNIKIKKPEKKLMCPRCPKVFAFNNKLQRHLLTHTGEKPIKCDYCEKRFRDNYDRNVHLRKEHNLEPLRNY
ncbi:zinc finger protein 664-like [Cylas formicarius]|uniref:zinc finger protein 664-like n=1 Tax=Cylas formicarius TaxID=197179 RepID=UPI0029587659|nr:zinc finger protein 664-like [Cylas formicarius]